MTNALQAYAFDASERTVVMADPMLGGYPVMMVVNLATRQTLYLFNDPALGGTWDPYTLTLVLDYDTTGMNDTDPLLIIYEDYVSMQTMMGQQTVLLQDILTALGAGTAVALLNKTTNKRAEAWIEGTDDSRHIEFGTEADV